MLDKISQEDLEMTGQNEVENEALKKYSELSHRIIKQGGMAAYSEMHDFIADLRDKYGLSTVNQCRMYHILIGSGVLAEQVSEFDFKEDDSIVSFLNQLAEKYLKEPTGE